MNLPPGLRERKAGFFAAIFKGLQLRVPRRGGVEDEEAEEDVAAAPAVPGEVDAPLSVEPYAEPTPEHEPYEPAVVVKEEPANEIKPQPEAPKPAQPAAEITPVDAPVAATTAVEEPSRSSAQVRFPVAPSRPIQCGHRPVTALF
eukprot:Hpha_TRINITY_DN13750_c0_g2::TRINITY_DN13750_c0_g2_i1::g.142661::m.142661